MTMDENSILLSFIIPVYNVELYLQECVDSILQQMTSECEIILVDDGSTDSSGAICELYAEKYSGVKMIHKENGGLSSARNAGIPVTEGKYVTFVDSDDRIFPNTIREILRWIKSESADICFMRTVKFYPDGTQNDLGEGLVRSQLYLKKREDAIKHLASRSKYPGSAWGKLFRREWLVDHDLHFPYDRRYSEDLGFIRDCILNADSFDFLDILYYQYRQKRQGSITYQFTSRNFYDLMRFITESADLLTINEKATDSVNKAVMSFAAYEYAVSLYIFNRIGCTDQKEILAELKKMKWVLRYSKNKKTKIIAFACSLLGVKLTTLLLEKIGDTVRK